MAIRQSTEADHDALYALYPAAFPDEDLLSLLADVLAAPDVLSLVAEHEGKVVGHVAFTPCDVAGQAAKLALLAPLCVAPRLQKQGIGQALIRSGLDHLKAQGIVRVLVLGDPNYYGRTGFVQENHISTPYPMPQDWKAAWQSQSLLGQPVALEGQLQVPDFWQKPELWAG